ncbi:hypothetical protein [Kordiimonas sp.]|uniref:hypothetical protein n=1 Tax=Kordiimonas sp. TaxID=1970157 RepID=UPI003A92482F
MGDDYAEAVAWAKRVTAPLASKGAEAFEDFDPLEIIFKLRLGVYWLQDGPSEPGRYGTGKMICSKDAAWWLWDQSKHTPAAYKILCDVCANFIARGIVLEDPLRGFAAQAMTGFIGPPKHKNPKAMKTAGRNLFFLAWLNTIKLDHGLDLTRGDAAQDHRSACDALAEGMAANGYHVTFRALKELCVGKSHDAARQTAHELGQAWSFAKQARIIPEYALERAFYGV